jgi:hypothetical protein
LFLLEGVPSIILGFVVLNVLTERPEEAAWLTKQERAAPIACLREDAGAQRHETTRKALTNARTWLLAVVGAAAAIALVNSVGNTGGFVGPDLLGAINDATHSFAYGLLAIAIMLAGGAMLVLLVRDDS